MSLFSDRRSSSKQSPRASRSSSPAPTLATAGCGGSTGALPKKKLRKPHRDGDGDSSTIAGAGGGRGVTRFERRCDEMDPAAVYTRRHDGGVRRMRREVGGVTRRQGKRGSVCGLAAANELQSARKPAAAGLRHMTPARRGAQHSGAARRAMRREASDATTGARTCKGCAQRRPASARKRRGESNKAEARKSRAGHQQCGSARLSFPSGGEPY